jgi:ADP-ribose pyrophosphatase YjhB (NUDIX family)
MTGQPKLGEHNREPLHYSAGAWVTYGGGVVLLDRINIPYGFAAPAGHVDEGETSLDSFVRELGEETGLKPVGSIETICQDVIVKGNSCKRGVHQHSWSVYALNAEGSLRLEEGGANSVGVYSVAKMKRLLDAGKFEPVWDKWIREYDLLDRV